MSTTLAAVGPRRSWRATRWRVVGGALGPAAFIVAWSLLGARTAGYSAIDDPISRLAAVGAATRAPMTVGMLVYAIGVGRYADELGDHLGRPVANAAYLSVIATLGIALTPLDSALGGAPHAAAAGLTYASLAAIPLLAARPLARQGHRAAAIASLALGAGALVALASSVVAGSRTGLWQRAGLTLGDAWLIGSAAWVLSRTRRATCTGCSRGASARS